MMSRWKRPGLVVNDNERKQRFDTKDSVNIWIVTHFLLLLLLSALILRKMKSRPRMQQTM